MAEHPLQAAAAARFRRELGGEPVWSARAPGRVNLIGEHLDYVGGLVLPAAIDRYVALSGAPAGEWRVSAETGGAGPYLEALAAELGAGPQHVAVEADLPPARGLGSSAALLVAAAAALGPGLEGLEAAQACQRAEHAVGVRAGIMDHFAAAMGRAGCAVLLDCATLEHRYLPFPEGIVIAVLDSGVGRRLADTPYDARRSEAEAAVAAAGGVLGKIEDPGQDRRLRHLVTELGRVREFVKALEAPDAGRLGELLDESHRSLRDDFEVSLPELDELVIRARSAPGCLGVRLMGAGFGGSAIALLAAGHEEDLRRTVETRITFCRTADGAFVHGRAA